MGFGPGAETVKKGVNCSEEEQSNGENRIQWLLILTFPLDKRTLCLPEISEEIRTKKTESQKLETTYRAGTYSRAKTRLAQRDKRCKETTVRHGGGLNFGQLFNELSQL